jgi:hypothetical protein
MLPRLFHSRELQLSKLNQLCSARKQILSNNSLLSSKSFLLICSHECQPKIVLEPRWFSFTVTSPVKNKTAVQLMYAESCEGCLFTWGHSGDTVTTLS